MATLPLGSGLGINGYYEAKVASATTSVVGDSVAVVAPFAANAAGTSTAGVVAQQADQIMFGGIHAVFEKVLDESQAVTLLNSFLITEQNGNALLPDHADDKDPKFNVDIVSDVSGFKSVLEAIITTADEVYGSADVSGKKVKSYLEEEMRVQIVKQLSSSGLSDMLEASNVSNVLVSLNVPAGSADMASKIGAPDAASKRKLFMTQIPMSTLTAYIPENAKNVKFLPMRGADSITFIYDLTVSPPSQLDLIQAAPAASNLLGDKTSISSSAYSSGILPGQFLTTNVVRRVAFVAHLTGIPAYFLRDSDTGKLETSAKRITDKANDLSGSLAALKSSVKALENVVPLQREINEQAARNAYAMAMPAYLALDISEEILTATVNGYNAATSGLIALATGDKNTATTAAGNFEQFYLTASADYALHQTQQYNKGVAIASAALDLSTARVILADASANKASANLSYDQAYAAAQGVDDFIADEATARAAYYNALENDAMDISSKYIGFKEAAATLGDAQFKAAHLQEYADRKTAADQAYSDAVQLESEKVSALNSANGIAVPVDPTLAAVNQKHTDWQNKVALETAAQSDYDRLVRERNAFVLDLSAATAALAAATNPKTVLDSAITLIGTQATRYDTLKALVDPLSVPAKTSDATLVTPPGEMLSGLNTASLGSAISAYNTDAAKHNLAKEAHTFITTTPIATKIRPAGLKQA